MARGLSSPLPILPLRMEGRPGVGVTLALLQGPIPLVPHPPAIGHMCACVVYIRICDFSLGLFCV